MTVAQSQLVESSDGTAATTPPVEKSGDRSFNIAAHGLRGIASLMVFFAHLVGGTAEHVYASSATYVALITPFWNFGTFGVCLFFVISGFVILPSAIRYSPGEFAARRFLRIYPLFATLSVLFIVLNAATNLYPATNDPLSILAGLTFLNLLTHTEQLTPNAWSLTFEVWYYAFTAIGVYLALRRRSALGLAILGLAALLFVARYPISFYFIAGAAIRLGYDRFPWLASGRHRLAEMVALTATIALSSLGHHDYHWSEFRDPVVPLLVVATATYFALAVSRNSLTSAVIGNRLLRYFGTVSYSLYLVHPYTYFAMRAVFSRAQLFTANIGLSMTAFIVVTSAITWVLTHLANRTLELWPYETVYHQKVYRPGLRVRATLRPSSWLRAAG